VLLFADFIALLEEIDRLYGPRPGLQRSGQQRKQVVMVLDNGPIHVSKAPRGVLAARMHWLTVEWLPRYTPELNDKEQVWRDLKTYHLAHRTFQDIRDLEQTISKAVQDQNSERHRHPLAKQRISV
jgi:transposase